MEGDGEPAEEKEKEEEKGEEEREEQEEKEQQQDKAEDGESKVEGDGEPEEEYTIFGGKKVKVEYSGTKLKALRGNMSIEYPEKTQIVRIFTSSTFTGLFVVVRGTGSPGTTVLITFQSCEFFFAGC